MTRGRSCAICIVRPSSAAQCPSNKRVSLWQQLCRYPFVARARRRSTEDAQRQFLLLRDCNHAPAHRTVQVRVLRVAIIGPGSSLVYREGDLTHDWRIHSGASLPSSLEKLGSKVFRESHSLNPCASIQRQALQCKARQDLQCKARQALKYNAR